MRRRSISLLTGLVIALVAAPISSAPTVAPAAVASLEQLDHQSPITVEEIIRDGDRALLKVRNRTPFMVIMHVAGVRVGWMRPYRTGLIRGLVPGYHKLYAHSRFGSMSWGPREIWVPGTWNLVY